MAVAMVEQRPAGRSVNYVEAADYLTEFLWHRATPTRELRRLDPRGDPDGAFPQSAADGLPPAPRHEMAGQFVAEAIKRVDRPRGRDDLCPFPDRCWIGWEAEILRLPYIENRAVTLLLVEKRSGNEACSAVGRSPRTLADARDRGIRTLVVNLLAVNPPPAR